MLVLVYYTFKAISPYRSQCYSPNEIVLKVVFDQISCRAKSKGRGQALGPRVSYLVGSLNGPPFEKEKKRGS